ncbi:hypothetical protein NIES267_57670 [Calothrix parasitica NIES-267]|uniref:Uncharacterized protein n=1 Tax=Calothrix parasitica NIES-267 TaxID=1973488 RepID=A0A1Z4LYN4_9CYAN|nr:hypothetical protein NIES267_57670 [Calothrix parasitica NIES-267]
MMNKSFLHGDDLPPKEVTKGDKMLLLELERTTGKCFYDSCDAITQALISNCFWYLTIDAEYLTLVIHAPDIITYWHIVSNIVQLGMKLEPLASSARIRVCPPPGKATSFEIGVDEVSAFRDWL